MRYPMRFLSRAGLMSALLIGGVLGGLAAPLPSEALNTTVTFQVDSGSTATLIDLAPGAASTCTVPSGYSRCYALPTGGTFTGSNSRSYTILGYGSGVSPRLLVSDTTGLDNLTITTVEFKPVWPNNCVAGLLGWCSDAANLGTGQAAPNNYGERHTLKVVITHRFDQAPNVRTINAESRYSFALAASGMFKGNPTDYTTINSASGSGDFVSFTGQAKFGSGDEVTTLLSPFPPNDSQGALPACNTTNSRLNAGRTPPSDVNYCPLRRTIASTTAPTSSFSSNPALEQVATYPNYFCDNSILVPPGTGTSAGASARCTPTAILTLTATLNGPDSWVLSSSGDAPAGTGCNLLPSWGPPLSTPARICKSNADPTKDPTNIINLAIGGYITQQNTLNVPVFSAENAEPTPACVGEACNCQDPTVCGTGTIVIKMYADVVNPDFGTVGFQVTGNEMLPVVFGLTSHGSLIGPVVAGSRNFTGLTTGNGGGVREIRQVFFPPTHIDGEDSVWHLDAVVCDGESGQVTLVLGPDVAPPHPQADLIGVLVNYVNVNQTVTCSFDNHHTHDGVDSPYGHPHSLP